MPTVLIAGVSGLVGFAAAKHFAALPGWKVIAVSRRLPEGLDGVELISVDLTDRARCAEVFGAMRDVTHLVYAALYEKPGLIAGWRSRDQMDTNLRMLRNLFEPLQRAARSLQHVTLLQGTKAYGSHIEPVPVPARARLRLGRHLARLSQRELQYQQRRSGRMAHAVAGDCRRPWHAARSTAADVARAGNAEARGRMGGDRAQVPPALAAEPGAVRRPVVHLHRPQFCLRAIRVARADAGEHGEGAPRRIPRLRRHRADVPAPLRPLAGAALAAAARLIERQLAARPDAAALRSTACEDQ